jgi:hypothetical protein
MAVQVHSLLHPLIFITFINVERQLGKTQSVSVTVPLYVLFCRWYTLIIATVKCEPRPFLLAPGTTG